MSGSGQYQTGSATLAIGIQPTVLPDGHTGKVICRARFARKNNDGQTKQSVEAASRVNQDRAVYRSNAKELGNYS